jgi:hypothetical protein
MRLNKCGLFSNKHNRMASVMIIITCAICCSRRGGGNLKNHTEKPGNAERSGACEELVIQQAVHLGLVV